MLTEPVLLLPAFRSGRETPWAGDMLRHCYEKYALGNQIGESYDFSLLPQLESTTPDGEKLSSVLQRTGIAPDHVPFLIKWIDAEKAMSMHVHPHDEYLVVIKARADAKIHSCCFDMPLTETVKETLLTENAESIFHAKPLAVGDILFIPAGTLHALQGATCYQIQHPSNATYRLYDWARVNARGQKRALQMENALSLLTEKTPVFLTPSSSSIIETNAFHTMRLSNFKKHLLSFDGHFAVLTCLESSFMQLENGKHLYLSAGQSVFLPQSKTTWHLTSPHCLLTVSQE